ncbi:MAG: tRNA (adenosine(37)-N6)-threonylcarbamoyltransferase complex ATPase subunit type 1 TsaE [Gammaproteobacteria bacterium RIFCSPHIGHO2_02_FULL_39_13]|nr:MAG: tRNA (adenosine(37)-N6)-threonylcarbamoyltransferase complex ATPase subunit type 1 TsaE [Gammaproteobacteria bacterium RIFCSPHIGHO2_02_FULL_39_13]OGT49347.1 MAG: tRNA (adenosine(37)-N6)-threonylcarbamoyltransferase complex ATPase subunit type 1 TsaE [Gammaproteobacteria bacterium RIFCSPHIGHO2_12_FULL_39_24]
MSQFYLKTAEETEAIAQALAQDLRAPSVIFLEGQLGAGKTTFVKGLLRGFGYEGLAKSPTYTLVEIYPTNEFTILHADLYRIKDSSELEAMGFRDYFNPNTIAVIEWASRAEKDLPKPQILCTLKMPENGVGRFLTVEKY